MIDSLVKIPDTSGGLMSVTNEQRQLLRRSAHRPSVALQIHFPDGPHTGPGELSAILRFGPGSGAVRQGAAGTGHVPNSISLSGGNAISLGGGRAARPHRVMCQLPARALPGPRWCNELTPKTTESHWSGGQREP
jgi:hypothetical protein